MINETSVAVADDISKTAALRFGKGMKLLTVSSDWLSTSMMKMQNGSVRRCYKHKEGWSTVSIVLCTANCSATFLFGRPPALQINFQDGVRWVSLTAFKYHSR